MLLKSCLNCKYHEIKDEWNEQTSHCSKENCYSRYSKCIAQKALNRLLKDESLRQNRSSSALAHSEEIDQTGRIWKEVL